MTGKELYEIKQVLEKIKNKDSNVERAIAFVDKDIALRVAQSKAEKDNQSEYDMF